MTKLIKLLFIGLGLCLSMVVHAKVPKDIQDNITAAFDKSLPSLKIDEIDTSPISDVYEVTSGPVIMYVTKDGKYAIMGDILDLRDGETNITEDSRKQARLSALDRIGEDRMVIFPAKDQKYVVTVFTDLDCVYCRKFHSQIADINRKGITIRYLAFPRAGNKSTSFEKAVNVWCADNPQEAMTKAKQGQPIPNKQCKQHNIEEQFHLGVMAGISGTPSMILDDGTLVAGYYEPQSLVSILQSVHQENKDLAKKQSQP